MVAKRCFIMLLLFSLLFMALTIRLFDLQVIENKEMARAASVQRLSNVKLQQARGNILDRNGIPLTCRDEKYIVAIKPLLLKNDEYALWRISYTLGIDYHDLKYKVENGIKPILFEVPEDIKNEIINIDSPGISVINMLSRYSENSVARHILGYLNKVDGKGEVGIEKFYNKTLSTDTWYGIGVITDGINNILPGMGYRLLKWEDNKKILNVKLTIDYHIQKIVEDVMEENNINGAIVIEEVKSGDIVAIASKPDYDQNNVSKYLNSSGSELFNKAVASYNLGSIFKIIDVATLLKLNGSTWNEKYICTGSIRVGDREYKCYSYEEGGHGLVDMKQAFALSCNTYFIHAMSQVDPDKLLEMARRFGLGNYTGIIDQGIDESQGNLPASGVYLLGGDIANISIGQGEIMATPLQIADIVATIANGGIKNKINIADCIEDEDGKKVREIREKSGSRILERRIVNKIQEMMESVIDEGTGIMIDLAEFGGAAGKTASAETGQIKNGENVVHAWFAGYFPRKNPKYAIAVFIENGRIGGRVAGPIFQKIAEEIMKRGY